MVMQRTPSTGPPSLQPASSPQPARRRRGPAPPSEATQHAVRAFKALGSRATSKRLAAQRASMAIAIDGDSDQFETRSSLVQNVAETATQLSISRRVACVDCHTGMWMAGVLLAVNCALFVVMDGNALVNAAPHAWGDDESEGEWQTLGPGTTAGSHFVFREVDRPPPQNGYSQRFEVNDPVAAFLGITALVYALIFASAYTEAQQRLEEIRRSLVQEANGVHTAMLLVCDTASSKRPWE
eukprot:COSAG01_NODE_212_length_21797_cov_14.197806_25_plen_240_part_00